MNLEQVIHERWAAGDELNSLLPAERVKTGRSFGGPLPYATVVREQGRPVLRTHLGEAIDEVTLQISVWHDNYDAGWAIAEGVKGTFDRSAFTLAGGDRVLGMCRTQDMARQDKDGTWRFSIKFLVQVYLSSGV